MSDATPKTPPASATAMPRWLIYGLVAKGALVVAITVAVLFYAGIL